MRCAAGLCPALPRGVVTFNGSRPAMDTAQTPPSSPLPLSAVGLPANGHGRSAFWTMTRRVTVIAAGVDLAFLLLFLALGSPVLAWLNVLSVALYGAAYWLLRQRRNNAALVLIWVEVLGHAAIGTVMIGWQSGFHYYLLMFIPAIVVSGRVRLMLLLLAVLLAFYLGLHAVALATVPLTPLGGGALAVVHTFNVAVVFTMAAFTARFYYLTVRRAERKLAELAATDSLTGLANRRSLLALAGPAMATAAERGAPVAMILADIDHFKAINDRHGHEVGDRVITQAAALLAGSGRSQDVVARWGGEEFLMLLPDTSLAQAMQLAEQIRLQAPGAHGNDIDASGDPNRYTLSLGVTEATPRAPPGECVGEAIARADRALYRSKADGRNRVSAIAAA